MTSDWPVLGSLMENLMEKVRNYTRVSQCIPPTNKWSNRSREPLFGKLVVSSGASIYLPRWVFSLGRYRGERLKHWIRLRGGGGFTTMKNKSLTTFYFIVKRLGFFYNYFLFSLVCLGSFPLWLERLFLVDMTPLWAKSVKKIGRQLHYVSFG